MTKDHAITHFGTQVLLAKALGLSQGSISLWGQFPPEVRQLQLEVLTDGALRAEPACDKYRAPLPAKAAA